jgi:hypothetical protein
MASSEETADVYDPSDDGWETVYYKGPFSKFTGDSFPEVHHFTYYQTYGGGPEGGYITDGTEIFAVHRSWFTLWSLTVIKGKTIEYEEENMIKCEQAKVRLIRK